VSAEDEPDRLRRQLRVMGILAGATRAGLAPLRVGQLHTIAYFADALAPVWGLTPVDGQLLKKKSGPRSPVLQNDLDVLVGQGVVEVLDVDHVQDEENMWRLDASYRLNWELARPILEQANAFTEQAEQVQFAEEVVFAVSALPADAIEDAAEADASYGSVGVAFGGMVDMEAGHETPNLSSRVALRFGALLSSEVQLSPAEMVHLYVRELDKRLRRAA